MAELDLEIREIEMERDSWRAAVSALESAMADSSPGTRNLLLNSLESARGHVALLEKRIREAKAEREFHEKQEMALQALALRETWLSAQEKETYNSFLKEDFFQKGDFARLDEFYRNTWDRLSEGGKDLMSQRIWEGIRRHEYSFGELPEAVREKEMGRVYERLTEQSRSRELSGASAADREEFIEAFQAGDRARAIRILDRRSFSENVFLGNGAVKDGKTELGREAAKNVVVAQSPAKEKKTRAHLFGDLKVDASSFVGAEADGSRTAVAPNEIAAASVAEKIR